MISGGNGYGKKSCCSIRRKTRKKDKVVQRYGYIFDSGLSGKNGGKRFDL